MTAERSLLAALEAGCSAPIGAYAVLTGRLQLNGVVLGVPGMTVPAALEQAGGLDAAAGGGTIVVRNAAKRMLRTPRASGVTAARMLALGAADLIGAKTDRDDAHDDMKAGSRLSALPRDDGPLTMRAVQLLGAAGLVGGT